MKKYPKEHKVEQIHLHTKTRGIMISATQKCLLSWKLPDPEKTAPWISDSKVPSQAQHLHWLVLQDKLNANQMQAQIPLLLLKGPQVQSTERENYLHGN